MQLYNMAPNIGGFRQKIQVMINRQMDWNTAKNNTQKQNTKVMAKAVISWFVSFVFTFILENKRAEKKQAALLPAFLFF